MSFSIVLNSTDGNQLVANQNNAIQYNFDFGSTPPHEGRYKVNFCFASGYFGAVTPLPNNIFININLGNQNIYKTDPNYTNATVISQLGRATTNAVRGANVSRSQLQTGSRVANIPINSKTAAYVNNEIETAATFNVFRPSNFVANKLYKDSLPLYLNTKPSNNLLLVTLTTSAGVLWTVPPIQQYTLILTFEAI